MSAKGIYESTAKRLLETHLRPVDSTTNEGHVQCPHISITCTTYLSMLATQHKWLCQSNLVVKPDQLIKRRGKLGLIGVNMSWGTVMDWLEERRGREQKVGNTVGVMRRFIVEPFVPHADTDEMYVCIYSERACDTILFYHAGGVDVGDVDAKACRLNIPVRVDPEEDKQLIDRSLIVAQLLGHVENGKRKDVLAQFIQNLYEMFVNLHFTYLEINPLVILPDAKQVFVLDMAAKLDATADFICKPLWGDIVSEFPAPFGRDRFEEESYIADLDAKSGASLKLTILNKLGRIWTMVAGGGASVIYSDTICDLGGTNELANYGEYSGAPSEHQTYEYAKCILQLMTQNKHPDGKVLLIGGGIANFTNVAATFHGIITALIEFKERLIDHRISVFVRRAGPNYQEALRRMREVGQTLGIPLYVFGPETHMTAIVGMAMGQRPIPSENNVEFATANFLLPSGDKDPINGSGPLPASTTQMHQSMEDEKMVISNDAGKSNRNSLDGLGDGMTSTEDCAIKSKHFPRPIFTVTTKAIVWGLQNRAVQSMLDFDFVCRRQEPSVVAIVYPFMTDHKIMCYWGHKEILIPVYRTMGDAVAKHNNADVLVNFASLRSAYQSTMDAMNYPQIRTIAIIAEGIPENQTRKLIRVASERNIIIIGPATVGGIKPGCFKIGNTGGMMDNILHSKLYRPGSVAYVSRSGGMSNELNNIISKATDGVYEGVAIGGDKYPGTTFIDHVMRYQYDNNVKMIVLLGEVGGTEELRICEAIDAGTISKPMVAWCIGTCSNLFNSEVQFGHAGSCASSEFETAVYKNAMLRKAGAQVPQSFDQLGEIITEVFQRLVSSGMVQVAAEVPPPTVPMDFNWARELGLIRKPASFMTSICDERGQELVYAGMPITDVLQKNLGIGGVISLLWFQRCLPAYCCKFFEMCLMVTADHGPAVSGAHNTIVCARAGKDLVSSLVSGLLTIGDRFGGALDGAARQFSEAYDTGMHPAEFVNFMRNKGELIMGIGHRVKSINNPDKRVSIVKEYVMGNFPATPLLMYALEVEKITTRKKPNLILNVDGVIACAFVDMLRNCGSFTSEEAQEYINIGAINSLFVLGRSVGFIGHYMDQKRLKQGLYRHPWDDISYVLPEQYNG